MSEGTIQYFAYGANRDPRMIKAITGSQELVGRPGILEGYTLCVQKLNQVPDTISETSPAQISPRALLKESWPDTFESYIIKTDPKGKIVGTIWELTPLQRELVRGWELVDFGWYKDINTSAITKDGQVVQVQTEGLRDGQEVDREVDGHNYETWLNSAADFERVAEKARREYFERISQTQEGKIQRFH
ncbi:MAG: gamma-glutamylcyclotransferase family protein [Candidatus Levybacteria bacterium]|nr:gamma-glutamylcyclotransferase family protein [Candidatus Levybacteria bacterium]